MKKLLVIFVLFLFPVINLSASGIEQFNVNVADSGEYYLEVEYESSEEVSSKDLVDVSINGEDAGVFELEKNFSYDSKDYELDRYGKEIVSTQSVNDGVHKMYLQNEENTTEANTFNLNQGNNVIKLSPYTDDFNVISIKALKDLPVVEIGSKTSTSQVIEVEAESFDKKNEIAINAKSRASATVTPKSPASEKINVIDGKTFDKNGMYIDYNVNVAQEGSYDLYLSGITSGVKNLKLYFNIYVNDKLAGEDVAIDVTNSYMLSKPDITLYLQEGENRIRFEIANDTYYDVITSLIELRDSVSLLATSVKQITGGITDESRDWGLTNFMPELESSLNGYVEEIADLKAQLIEIGSEDVDIINTMDLMTQNLEELILDVDNVPNHMALLSEGTTSVLTLTNQIITRLTEQGYEFDKFYLVSAGEKLDYDKVNVFDKIAFSITSFASSFSLETIDEGGYDTEIEVWVNKPRQYVDIMQKLADQEFTPESGIKVNFSVLTDQNKITMANAANETPDLALSIDSWYAYELGLRGALMDLRELDFANDMIANVAPGGMLQVIVEDKLYGIPETQDLHVMYYRTDIFESFGYEVPTTWNDVLNMLPDLMGNGMNFYIPLSSTASLKSFVTTAPFFMQNDVPLYTSDGFSSNLTTEKGFESLENMTNMYNLYGLELNTANFFDSFKSGDIPIGISNFATYIQLQNAADEISGSWDIAVVPGMVDENGNINHSYPGSTTVDVIFEAAKNKEAAAEFLHWWTSTEIQTSFNDMLMSIYGVEYIWNSANTEAFLNLPLPKEHLEVFEETQKWIQEVPKVPGGYIVERSISDIWNGVIFDSDDLKRITEEKNDDINLELERKMIEFGYMDSSGNVIKEYPVPTIDTVRTWLEEDDE